LLILKYFSRKIYRSFYSAFGGQLYRKKAVKKLQFLPYGRSIGSWMSYTQDVYMSHGTEYNRHAQHCNVFALYIDVCLGFHDILVYWNGSTLYNFRMSNYVQQRKTYTRKVATVHLNCSTVLCNTLCARIAAAV
jgi:hypothetical protein